MPAGKVRFNTARALMVVPLVALAAWGVGMIYSTTFALPRGDGITEDFYMKRQLVWLIAGSFVAVVLWRLDYRNWENQSRNALFILAIPLGYLAFASLLWSVPGAQDIVRKFPLIPFRHDSPLNGAFRWIRLGPVSIQPSEFAKPLLIFYLAAHFRLPLRTETLRRGVLAPVAMAGGILALVFLGRDLSTTVITGAIVAAIFFIAGVRLRYLFAMGCLGLVFVGLVVAVSDVRRQRIVDYLAHQENEKSGSDQVVQARMAMGSGGKTGLGFTLSRFKRLGLPEAHTDFIVAIVGEEAGFMGVMGVILAYALMSTAIFWIAAQASDPFGQLLAMGVGLTLSLQAFVNVSVVSGFCPATGVTAPFLSYGGSSMLSCMICIGLVLSVSRVAERRALDEQDETQTTTEQLSRRLNLHAERGPS